MQSRAGTIQSVPETPDSLSGLFFPARVKSSTLKLPDVTIASVTAVSSHHTFISEMSYLKRNGSSICHPWCHHLSASESASTCSDPPSIPPVPNFVPQLFRHPDSSPNLTCVNADPQTDSCKLLSSRALNLSVCDQPVYARKEDASSVAHQFLEVTWSRCS